MDSQRDYNKEFKDTNDHKYAYNFDFDIMHPFMLKSFQPFLKKGNLLELGSFKGDFTKRLLPYFDDITCIEASEEAINIAKKELNGKIPLIGFAGAPWTIFAYMVEGHGSKTFSKAKKMLFTEPELSHLLLEKITQSTINYFHAQVKAGADMLQIFVAKRRSW